MGTTYFRRYRTEIDLRRTAPQPPVLPDGYRWVCWKQSVLERHAWVQFESFRTEIDSQVFACLGDSAGCRRLMREISEHGAFLPAATWLVAADGDAGPFDCGTIQGIQRSRTLGAVQNVGVIPSHRGLGLGKALVLKALVGFRQARVRRVYLGVTAENTAAVRLYHSLGFRLTRTMYKAVDIAPPAAMAQSY